MGRTRPFWDGQKLHAAKPAPAPVVEEKTAAPAAVVAPKKEK